VVGVRGAGRRRPVSCGWQTACRGRTPGAHAMRPYHGRAVDDSRYGPRELSDPDRRAQQAAPLPWRAWMIGSPRCWDRRSHPHGRVSSAPTTEEDEPFTAVQCACHVPCIGGRWRRRSVDSADGIPVPPGSSWEGSPDGSRENLRTSWISGSPTPPRSAVGAHGVHPWWVRVARSPHGVERIIRLP